MPPLIINPLHHLIGDKDRLGVRGFVFSPDDFNRNGFNLYAVQPPSDIPSTDKGVRGQRSFQSITLRDSASCFNR